MILRRFTQQHSCYSTRHMLDELKMDVCPVEHTFVLNTCLNGSPNAFRCSFRKSDIVETSGWLPAANSRKATPPTDASRPCGSKIPPHAIPMNQDLCPHAWWMLRRLAPVFFSNTRSSKGTFGPPRRGWNKRQPLTLAESNSCDCLSCTAHPKDLRSQPGERHLFRNACVDRGQIGRFVDYSWRTTLSRELLMCSPPSL
jgi:hypothetical protein